MSQIFYYNAKIKSNQPAILISSSLEINLFLQAN
jgi:hypothetical protein